MPFWKNLLGKNKRHVELAPAGLTFETESGRTVLESALGQGIAFPHDCTVGTCGSCRAKLRVGQVDAITPFGYTLSADEIAAGYILACQAVAKTDLVLEVDVASDNALPTRRLRAELDRVDDLTHDIKRVTWRLPEPLRWRAGQYCNLRWNGSEVYRSYSFAHRSDREGSKNVSTFIRHVPGGTFTDLLFGDGLAGLAFEVEGPHGNFWLRDGNGPILCIAGGSGLAPIISLLQDAAARRLRRDCILLFGARTRRDLYAQDEIEAIHDQWTAAFDFWPILSEETTDGFRHGMVTDHILPALSKLGTETQAYMCGPPPMIDAGVHMLTRHNVSLGDIHYDKFTDASTRV